MARKNLLKGLMAEAGNQTTDSEKTVSNPPTETKSTGVDPAKPRRTTGAIGAVSQSIAQLKSRAVVEIDPSDIDAGGLTDRLEHDDEGHQSLVASLGEYGQQVPVLVRPHPETEGRYQIVYGRRRVLALRELKQPVKALVRDLDDQALVMAQGQENSARRDLTFIEKCNFAHQMRAAGYDRKAICDALSVDKTLISRMFSIVDRVGIDLIEAIGSAPGVGRDRWMTLADHMERIDIDPLQIAKTLPVLTADNPSESRFDAAMQASGAHRVSGQDPKDKPAQMAVAKRQQSTRKIESRNGFEIGRAVQKTDKVVLTLPRESGGKFADWLVDNLEEIYGDWVTKSGE